MSITRMPHGKSDAAPALLRARSRDDSLGVPTRWNAVLETILNHRSMRGFPPEPLPQGTLELLIAAAQSASSSSNLRLWSVVAVEEPSHKSRGAGLIGRFRHRS